MGRRWLVGVLLAASMLSGCSRGTTWASAAPQPTATPALSAGALAYLTEYRYRMDVLDPATTNPMVPADAAIAAGHGWVNETADPAEVSLVRYTNLIAGSQVEDDAKRKAGLIIKDRLAWVLVWRHFQQPVIAPICADKVGGKVVRPPTCPSYPGVVDTQLVEFVDATTGKHIEALTMGTGDELHAAKR